MNLKVIVKKVMFSSLVLSMFNGCTFAESPKLEQHRFIAVDNGANQLMLVDEKKSSNNWSVSVPRGTRDLQLIGNDKILVSHGNGASEYRLTDGKRLKVITDKYRGIQSARRLADGFTQLASIGGEIYTVDQKGKEATRFKVNIKGIDLRLIRVIGNGNLLIGCKKPRAVLEVNPVGKVVRNLPLPGKGYKAVLLKNGHVLASTGDEVKVLELDKVGKVLSFVGGKKEHPTLGLDFASGFDVLPNGHIVVSNWLGHGKHGTAAHLIEYSRDNKVAWKWENHKMAKQITNFLMLDTTK